MHKNMEKHKIQAVGLEPTLYKNRSLNPMRLPITPCLQNAAGEIWTHTVSHLFLRQERIPVPPQQQSWMGGSRTHTFSRPKGVGYQLPLPPNMPNTGLEPVTTACTSLYPAELIRQNGTYGNWTHLIFCLQDRWPPLAVPYPIIPDDGLEPTLYGWKPYVLPFD